MKYKYMILSLLGLLLTITGCQKAFLDTKIDTFTTDEAIVTNRNTLWSFANACYTPLQYGYAALDNNLFAAATDEAQQTVLTSNTLVFNLGSMNPNSNPESGMYKTNYDGIRAANFFLKYAINGNAFLGMGRDTITDPASYVIDKQNLKWFIAEAHVAKAYYYAELIKRFGGVPIINQTLQDASNQYVPKSTYDQVVDLIVSEIDNNKANLQVNWKTSAYTANDGRFSLGSALALKSRVLLYAASPLHNPTNDLTKWQKAAAAANDVMSTAGLGYVLNASYGSYFIGATSVTSNEMIFAVRRAADNNPETRNYPIVTPGGNSGICPTNNLVSAYEYIGTPDPKNPFANRDPRLSATVVTNGSTWNSRVIDESPGGSDDMALANTSKTGFYLKKFLTDNLNLVKAGTAIHHWVAYRYGEILLNYAESMNEAYGPDAIPAGYSKSARQALKMVRDRSSLLLPVVTTTDVAAFRDAVKHERMIELAFEDHRYWDLLRWKDAEKVLNQPVTGVRVGKDALGAFTYQTVNVASRVFTAPANYYYPFAYSEIVNSNNTLIQNPGY